jgi:hypothetical protein
LESLLNPLCILIESFYSWAIGGKTFVEMLELFVDASKVFALGVEV